MIELFLAESELMNLQPGEGPRQHGDVVYLSERNVQTLLMKLERFQRGEQTACTVIKHRQPIEVPYNQTFHSVAVVAVTDATRAGLPSFVRTTRNVDVFMIPDDEFYGAQDRPAGAMVAAEENRLNKPITGVAHELAREKWGYGHGGGEGEWANS